MAIRSARRWSGAILLLLCGVLAVPAPASAAAGGATAAAAADWLAHQFHDGKYLEKPDFDPAQPPVPDVGLTVDGILGLASAGAGSDRVAAALVWVTDPDVLAGYVAWAGPGLYNAAPLAKVILAIEAGGGDPTAVHGVDLVAALRGMLTTTGPSAGLFRNPDPLAFDDTNEFGQSLAILALARTPGGVPDQAVTFLAATRCPGAGFPGTPTVPPPAQNCFSSVDDTTMVAQALLAAGHADLAKGAIDWLESVQDKENGAFSFDGGPAGENSNSTGLAAEALRAFDRTGPADHAAEFIRGIQLDCAGPAPHRGAVPFLPLDPANPDNTGYELYSAERATAQAILGLTGVPLGQITIAGATAGTTGPDCPLPPGAGGVLPVTGSSLTLILFIGTGLVALGTGLLIGIRRRREVVRG